MALAQSSPNNREYLNSYLKKVPENILNFFLEVNNREYQNSTDELLPLELHMCCCFC